MSCDYVNRQRSLTPSHDRPSLGNLQVQYLCIMIMRSLALLSCVTCLLVFGKYVSPEEFKGPNSRSAYSMSCGSNLDACHGKAKEVCPKGYDILDRTAETVAVPYKKAMGATQQYRLSIECK